MRMKALGGLVLFVAVMGMTAIGMAPVAHAQEPSGCVLSVGLDAPVAVQTPITQGECDALGDIYTATDGAGWTNASGWATATNPCTWYGVRCDGTPLGAFGVTELDLSWNQLTGPLPSALGGLAHLQTLVLQGNDLTGPIPAEIGSLSGLTYLAMSDNPLGGEIPTELYGLTNLQLLVIEDAGLTGELSPAIAGLTDLNVLVLNRNELTGPIPIELDAMHALVVLQLEGNNFDAVDPDDARTAGRDENEPLGEVSVAVSCLDNNGRIDVTLTNDVGADTPNDFAVTVGALAPRNRQIAPSESVTVSVTGRADGVIPVSVSRDGVEIYADTVTVDCDVDLADDVEVVVVQSCLLGNGRIDVVLNNLSVSAADYQVTVGQLAPRTRTVDAGATDRVTVTGRAEGPIDVSVTRDGVSVYSDTLTVACDVTST